METELQRERETLLKADRDIAAGEKRLLRQQQTLQRMEEAGLATQEARELARLLHETLEGWQAHRILILARIAYLEAKEREAAPARFPPPRD